MKQFDWLKPFKMLHFSHKDLFYKNLNLGELLRSVFGCLPDSGLVSKIVF